MNKKHKTLGAYTGFLMLVSWVWELIGELELSLVVGLRWELVLWASGRGAVWRFFGTVGPKSSD